LPNVEISWKTGENVVEFDEENCTNVIDRDSLIRVQMSFQISGCPV